MDCAIDLITNSVQNYWAQAYEQQHGEPYQDIRTVKFSGRTDSACGAASAAMGPFYCPNDQRVYIDTASWTTCSRASSAPRAARSRSAYVIAHEYGHHVENLLGLLGRIRTQQGRRATR